MFYIYWILMMISLISSFAYLSNALHTKRFTLFLTSLVQCGLTVILPFMNLVFSTDVAQAGFGFLWKQINAGNIGAFLILFGYLVVFSLVIANGRKVLDDKEEHSILL